MKSLTLRERGERRIAATIHQRAQGRVKCAIVQGGRVVQEFPWQKNLILNSGLDGLCQGLGWLSAMTKCLVGTGTTNTNNGSLPGETGSGAATTFTGPASFDFTTSAAVGDMIKMTSGSSSGTEVRITAVTDATHVQYTPSATISAGEFIVYRTSQTALASYVKANSGYYGGGTTTDLGNVRTYGLTYEFTAEVGPVSYTEVGISSSTPPTNLFSRIKLASPVNLIATQQLRVTYELSITITPNTPVAKTFNITGWPVAPATTTDGDEQVQSREFGGGAAPSVLEPTGGSGGIFIGTGSTIAAFGTSPNVGTNVVKVHSLLAYTPLSFYRDRTATFAVLEAIGTTWRCMGLCTRTGAGTYNSGAFICVFDETQTKADTHTLTLTFRVSVGRTLG
jgi:hypothetical protein